MSDWPVTVENLTLEECRRVLAALLDELDLKVYRKRDYYIDGDRFRVESAKTNDEQD